MQKDVFIDGYKPSDIIKDQKNFLQKIKLKSYKEGFDKNGAMKSKIYLVNCIVEEINWQLVIIITYNKCIFSVNNKLQKA